MCLLCMITVLKKINKHSSVPLRWLVRLPAEERGAQQLRHWDLLSDRHADHPRQHAAGAVLSDHLRALLQHPENQRAARWAHKTDREHIMCSFFQHSVQPRLSPLHPLPQATLCSAGPGEPTECKACASSSSQRRLPTTWRAAWRLSSPPWRRLWRRWARKPSRNTSRPWPSAALTSRRSCLLSVPSTGGRSSPSSIISTEVKPPNSPFHLTANSYLCLGFRPNAPFSKYIEMYFKSLV